MKIILRWFKRLQLRLCQRLERNSQRRVLDRTRNYEIDRLLLETKLKRYRDEFYFLGKMFAIIMLSNYQSTYANSITLYSGTFEGEHPAPVLVNKVSRGDRFEIKPGKVSALVNYPDSNHSIITERVITSETGATVSCPWFMKIEGTELGTRVNENHTAEINHKVFCDDGDCKNIANQPIPKSELLFGRYNLKKITSDTGQDLGFLDIHGDRHGARNKGYPIYCPEFSVERKYSELHYFDRLLIIENFREQSLNDLDIDFRKIYLTFENEKGDRATCVLTDLIDFGNTIKVADLKDCVLPTGDHFAMYAQSRFFLNDTRPCGMFVARGVKRESGYVPDWFMGWYECDGKADRTPIEKQYTYTTRVEILFNN